jgi:hypothetical protein
VAGGSDLRARARLEKVTGIPLWITILASGTLTTLYTALGGMRAVIWTDVMQLIVLFGGQLLIVIVALGKIPGGLGGVWDTAVTDGRMDLSFSFSLAERVNIWSLLLAGAFLHLVQMATDQVSVQRYLSAGSLKEAQRSLWIKLWFVLPVLVLFYGTGLVLYAFYKIHGDPLAAGLIAKEDQILPYFVVTQLPAGLPGLLIAAIYAASMSTISAGLNSLASATVVDFKQRLSKAPGTQAQQVGNARWITVGYGILVMALAFAVSRMPGNLVESVNTVIGLIGGPLLGSVLPRHVHQRADHTRRSPRLPRRLHRTAQHLPLSERLLHREKPAPVVSFIWFSLFGCIITMGRRPAHIRPICPVVRPAINDDDLARDVARGRRAQKRHRARDILRRADTAQQDLLLVVLEHRSISRLHPRRRQRRLDQTWGDAVHADAMIRQRHGERLRQHHQRPFARIIRAGIHLPLKAVRRGRDHNAAAALLGDETLRKSLRREKSGREIELHRLVPTLAGHFKERQVKEAACIANERVEAGFELESRIDQPLRAVILHQVCLHITREALHRVLKTMKHHFGSRFLQGLSHRQADALRGAGHERCVAIKRECFHRRA